MDFKALFARPGLSAGGSFTKTWRIMRLTALFILVACLHVSARTYSQTVTLTERNASLQDIFKAIHQQTGYQFFYEDALLDKAGRISIVVKDAPVDEVLAQCLHDLPITFTIINKTIVVKEKSAAALAPPVLAPPGEVDGVVLNESGQPLSGATVTVKGTDKMALTNEKGEFKLPNVPANSILIVTYVGYSAKQVSFKPGERVEVHLVQAVNQLDQVQIIAYGTTTERLSTGDVTTVKAVDIEKQPVDNLLEAIQGRVPGLYINQSSGLPGSGFSVQVLGRNSLINGNDPLYVVDGVPYTSELVQGLGSILGGTSASVSSTTGTYGNPLSFINPSDIESIDVLKDADATAIWGSRGANGVILITTKKGKAGKLRVNVSAYRGAGAVPHFLDLMNTQQWLGMRHEAYDNDNVTPTMPNAADLLFWDTTRYTDWQKVLLGGTAQYTDVQADVSGGNTNTQYLFGGGFHKETTVFPGNFSDTRGSFHANVTTTSDDQRFKMTFSGNYMYDNNFLVDLTSQINHLPPDAPAPLNPDGTLNWMDYNGTYTWPAADNPFAAMLTPYKGITTNLIANTLLSYRVLPGLQVKCNLGYTSLEVNENIVDPNTASDPTFNSSSVTSFFTSSIRSWIAEPQIAYERKIGDGKFEALAGSTFQQTTTTSQNLYASGFSSNALLSDMAAASTVIPQSVTDAVYKYNAGFGRVNYNWADKYLVNLTVRRDGSSRFGPANQFHDFAAAGAGWIFSSEEFLQKKLKWLSFGKLRGSYGTTGNDQIGDYQFLNLYNTNSSLAYSGSSGLTPSSLYNPNLAWESTKKLEGGLNLGLWKDRILLTGTYFRTVSSNELVSYTLSSVTGFTSIASNLPAKVENQGEEFSLTSTNVKTKNFTWTTSITLTIPKDRLEAFPNLATSSYKNTYVIGQPVSIRKTYQFEGVDPTKGLYEFRTAKGVDTTSPNFATDETALVNVDPKLYGGFRNSFSYKGFQLDAFFYFMERNGINFLYDPYYKAQPGYKGYAQPVQVLDRWQQSGDSKPFEMFSQATGNAYRAFVFVTESNRAYTNTSFLKLKNVSLSYELPADWKQKAHLKDLMVFVRGQNLLTFTHHYYGFDPETQSMGSVPLLRIVTAGVKVTL
jgi:TonB-dependent starch-binding outer membrane protein SusC